MSGPVRTGPGPITLCAISLGEPTLGRMVASALPLVEEVCICDTSGTGAVRASLLAAKVPGVRFEAEDTDRLAAIVERSNRRVPVRLSDFEWKRDFALARNASYAMASTDYCLWLDSDDELKGAADLAAWWKRQEGNDLIVVLRYDYEKQGGKCTVAQTRERIVPRRFGQWITAIHEMWSHERPCNVVSGPQHVFVDHDNDVESNTALARMERNLQYLEEHIAESVKAQKEPDRRLYYHYLLSLVCLNRFPEAVKAAKAFIVGEPPGIHRARVYEALADAYWKQGRFEDARGCAAAALAQDPGLLLPYVQLAQLAFREKRMEEALYWFSLGHEMGPKQMDPQLWRPQTQKPNWEMAAMAALTLRQWDRALQYARRANDRDLCESIQQTMVNEKHATQAIEIVSREDMGDDQKRQFVSSLPERIREIPELAKFAAPELPQDRLKIFIHCGKEGMSCGKNGEAWGPSSLKDGIGGSEEAVIRLSRELAAQGAHVEVYGPFGERGLIDGVYWRHYDVYDPERKPDVFVCWRYPGLAALVKNDVPTVLWSHDELWANQFARVPDALWGLSKYHVELLQKACSESGSYRQTRNGIPDFDTSLDAIPRDMGRCIYASSPDRGLVNLLVWWPKIVEAVKANGGPTPSLHIYYGFNIWWMEHEQRNPEKKKARETIEQLVKELEPLGVVWHGAVGQPELHEDFAKSNVWCYPTEFNEISCITAMKAQALGAVPVCSRYAALAETVKFGDALGSAETPDICEHEQAFIEAVATRLCSPDEPERENMMAWARAVYPWRHVATDWIEHLKEWTRHGRTNALATAAIAESGDRPSVRGGLGVVGAATP